MPAVVGVEPVAKETLLFRHGNQSSVRAALIRGDERPGRAQSINRRCLLSLAGGAVALAAVGCGGDEESTSMSTPTAGTPVGPVPGFDDPERWKGRILRVGAWGAEVQTALRQATWTPFATATGCRISEVTTDYGQLADAIRNGQSYADVLLVDAIWAATAADNGYVQAADLAAINPEAAAPFGGSDSAIPAYAYALIGGFRRDAMTTVAPPMGWAEWWDATRYPGPRALARDPFGSFEFALLADGVESADLYPLDGERAIDGLKAISERIVDRWWDSGAEPIHWLGTQRADLASAWHYRIFAGQQDGLAVDLVWQQGLMVADHWVVPVGAREPEVAVDYIRYALSAQAQAELARQVPLGPVNAEAFRLLDPMVTSRLPTAPANLAQLVPVDAGWWAANRGEAMQRFNTWLLGRPSG